MEELTVIITKFGFPITMSVGMGYFIFYVWKFVVDRIQPELDAMHLALIKCIDANRMLDNDMIRLQQKIDVVLKYEQIYGSRRDIVDVPDDSSRSADSQV
jgi:hypothetical protein|tara:strand:- start:5001 stop:5300 length:300 start_codon:yes stop_codon:yes gene_type:complete